MLTADFMGQPVNKSAGRKRLQEIGLGARTTKSIERKQQNLSAVLAILGYRHVIGLKPLEHYQDALVAALEGHGRFADLDRFLKRDLTPTVQPILSPRDVFVPPPPVARSALPTGLAKLVRKIDPAERGRQARDLGKAGEAFVMDIERQRLASAGQDDLIGDIRWAPLTTAAITPPSGGDPL
ncbi:MAG TPA: hypothetical protein ENH55_03745 [Aurantimonas coralicida]|uniref:Uncharacterized protein n=2 Tax=root TaxID=1 RepID=A0A9C9TJJ3_9HYPH|nr:hypothetical protein [Aurantimonas coralicida]HEU02851.1 hypothetical protein [Aurantimonas coralicida]